MFTPPRADLRYNQIAGHKRALIFNKDVRKEAAPGYADAVRRPMNLVQIKASVSSGAISSTRDFEHAVMLMFANALMYNNANTFVHEATLEMRAFAQQQFREFREIMRPTKTEQEDTTTRKRSRRAAPEPERTTRARRGAHA